MKKEWIGISIAGMATLCFIAIFITPSFGDELNYHYPLAKNITFKKIVDPHSDYSSAYMPLPYLVGHGVLHAFHSLQALRIMNFIVFLLAIFFFDRVARTFSSAHSRLTLLAFFNPYILFSSFVFYMYGWGVCFALAGTYFYLVKRSKAVADVGMALAVLSQQWMVVAVAAIILYEGTLVLERKLTPGSFVLNSGRKALFLLPAAAIFCAWGGFTHPKFASHGFHPSLEHLNIVLINMGFMFFLVVLAHFRSILKTRNIPLLFLLPPLFLSIPAYSSYNGANHINGFIANFASQAEKLIRLPYAWILFPFILSGLLGLVLILRQQEIAERNIFLYIFCGFLAAFLIHSRLASAHVFVALPFIILLLQREIQSRKFLAWAMTIQYLLVSLIFISYNIGIRSHGIEF